MNTYKVFILTAAISIFTIFCYLRVHALQSSLFFQNDIGRDLLVLRDWSESHKPPLLGPHTSFLPFNQSPIYYYIFFPIFLLSNHSPLTTTYSLVVVYGILFIIGFFTFFKNKELLYPYLTFSLLASVHPLLVTQQRYVWNPSFVTAFLAAAFFLLPILTNKISNLKLTFCTFFCALSIGMSVSAIPGVLLLIFFLMYKQKEKIRLTLLFFIFANILVFLPNIFFELKHSFQISQRLLLVLSGQGTEIQLHLFQNSDTLLKVLLPLIPQRLLAFILMTFVGLYLVLTKKSSSINTTAFFLFILSTLFLLGAPILIEAHYTYTSITFFLIWLATLPKNCNYYFCFIFCFVWLQPIQLATYFHTAPRTLEQTVKCVQQFCRNRHEPIFVSVQANYHSYHTGYEFRFLLKEANCVVKYVELNLQAASLMAVVSDGGEYIHGVTQFNELTQFGNSEQQEILHCSNNLSIHVLKK